MIHNRQSHPGDEARRGLSTERNAVASDVDKLSRRTVCQDLYCLGYVDNLVIVVKEKFAGVVFEEMHITLNTAKNWCNKESLSIVMKTQIVTFTIRET